MAAVLIKLLSGSLMPSDVIAWLTKFDIKDELPDDLRELNNLKSEFVPFYINYLRDQTFNLLQTGHSSNNTPAKTPLSSKFKRQFSKHKPDASHASGKGGKIRGQLFEPSEEGVALKSAPKKHHGRNSGSEHTPRSQRSIHFHTPDSSQRSKNKHSFGEFISPEVDWKKKSPHSSNNKRDDTFSPMQFSGRKSGGRKSIDKKTVPSTVPMGTTSPSFKLETEDFPSLSSGGQTSTPKLGSLPDGVRVITPSRRITTTVLKQGKSTKKSTLKDVKETGHRPESPGAGTKSALFASPSAGSGWNMSTPYSGQALTFEKTPGKNSSLEDERQLLRALRSGSVQSPADHVPSPIHGEAASLRLPTSADLELKAAVSTVGNNAQDVGKLESPRKSALQSTVNSTTPVKQCLKLGDIGPTKTPTKDSQDLPSEVSPASPTQVTYKQQLQMLAELYSLFIDENLVPNLTVELYFIVQLLTVRGGDLDESQTHDLSQDLDEVEYLSTVHNAVYFAVNMLSKQTKVLQLLDKGTLRLLVDNQRIVDFQPELKDTLTRMYDNCPAKLFPMSICSPIGGVSFQAETDNRNNFPSDQSFHSFRKQRDLFYELVRLWQENHMTAGWSVSETQGGRIKDLVTDRAELATHVHFCRLFQSQLLHMCKADHSHVKDTDESNVSLLVTLRKTNPDKFKRLQERFITPVSSKGPCPLPSFPGCQEFFRDFILCARCPHFYQHLANTLTTRIAELNQTEFHVAESLEDTSEVEERERLSSCLVSLRLLGKFLGLIHFLPYQCSEHLPAHVTNTCITLRNQVSPSLEVLRYVQSAQQSGHLVLTVPWIVEYLSMMDIVTPQTEYFQTVLMFLMQIHREATIHFKKKWSHSMLLVILYLGWLFELPVFPERLFFKEVTTGTTSPSEEALDSMGLVDQKILYTCCPYLGDLRMLLVEFAVGSSSRNNTSNVRKITPISTESTVSAPMSDKQLQHQLEDNFFHNHPASMKRTVDFVADRVASNHIKRFRALVLPSVLQNIYKEAKILATQMSGASPNTRSQKKSEDIIIQKSMYLCAEVRKSDKLEAAQYCEEKVGEILLQLLPEEVSPSVLSVCARISRRLAMEKVHTWMSTHITTAMMKREMSTEYEKQLRQLMKCSDSPQKTSQHTDTSRSPDKGNQTRTATQEHMEDVLGPADTLIKLKNTVCDIIVDKQGGEKLRDLLQIVEGLPEMFTLRQDLLPNISKSIGRLLADAVYFLIVEEPEFWETEAESCILSMTERFLFREGLFDHVISPIVLHSVHKARDDQRCWQLYSALLQTLLRKNLISAETLTTTAVNCIEQVPPALLQQLVPILLSLIITHHMQAAKSSEDFFPLIDTMFQVLEGNHQLTQCVEEVLRKVQAHHVALDQREKSGTLDNGLKLTKGMDSTECRLKVVDIQGEGDTVCMQCTNCVCASENRCKCSIQRKFGTNNSRTTEVQSLDIGQDSKESIRGSGHSVARDLSVKSNNKLESLNEEKISTSVITTHGTGKAVVIASVDAQQEIKNIKSQSCDQVITGSQKCEVSLDVDCNKENLAVHANNG